MARVEGLLLCAATKLAVGAHTEQVKNAIFNKHRMFFELSKFSLEEAVKFLSSSAAVN